MSAEDAGKGQRTGVGQRLLTGVASAGTALALCAVVRLIGRTAFVTHASWIDALCALAILLGCVLLCTCWYLDLRWPLCAVCLFGVLILQNLELDQQELHQHGRTEHVRVQQIGWSEGDGMDPAARRYTVTVLDGPPLAPFEEKGLLGRKWVVGGTYTVTVDPRGDAPLGRGARPGPPVIQRLLQLPLGLGAAFALWRPAGLLLRRRNVPSAGLARPKRAVE